MRQEELRKEFKREVISTRNEDKIRMDDTTEEEDSEVRRKRGSGNSGNNVNSVNRENRKRNDVNKDRKEVYTDKRQQAREKVKKRPPRTAAVTIRGIHDNFSYADAFRRARRKMLLKKMSIEDTRIRKTAMGGILIEIPGSGSNDKADHLIQELRKIFDKVL